MSSADDVARWMADEIERDGWLAQEDAAWGIHERFGEKFTYDNNNNNGNLAIAPEVLAAFRKLSEATVVWMRSERMWRRRESDDGPGRQVE